MPAVIRGETTILEHLLVENALTRYYTEALGVQTSNLHLGRMVEQLCHRFPHLQILEIGKYLITLCLRFRFERIKW